MNKAEPIWRRREDIAETPVEDDIFLVVPETEGIFHLNAVGTALWRLLAEPHSRDELVTLLSAAFNDVPPSVIARDVDGFLQRLKEGGLLLS
jgi:Coenzyme PQQ synthesis protein D (PqqD)